MTSTSLIEIQDDLAASRSGDREAFGRLVARYLGMVHAVAYSHTGDAALSEDIAQETFIAAWQRLDRLRHPERFGPWLAGIARNRALDAWRKRRRDPLHDAEPMEEVRVAPAVEANEGDKAALVWETLERLPAAYREVLALFYREGQDVRRTAALLGLTEDCVKQRLSRGRIMLRARVAETVEETLSTVRPSTGFALAVAGALPVFAAGQASAQAAAGGAAAVAGKGLAGAGSAAMLGGFAGIVAGMTGGFFGMWASIKNCPTLRVRRFMLRCAAAVYSFLWVFLGYQAACGLLLWQRPALMAAASAAGWIAYLPGLYFAIHWGNRNAMQIVREDGGVLPAPEVPLEASYLALRTVRRDGWIAAAAAAIASAVVAVWIASLPPLGSSAGLGAAALFALGHFVFVRMYRHGLAISTDEVRFEETAPAWGVDAWLHPDKAMTRQPSARARYWNDMLSLAGANWGAGAWLIAAPVLAGQPIVAGVVAGNCLAVTALSAWAFHRHASHRRRWYFAFMTYLGLFNGAVTARYASGWMAQGVELTPLYGWAGGAIVFGLYFVIGLALLRQGERAAPEV